MVTFTSGTSQTDYGFTGESYGDSTQLLYLRARYYNPSNGRFQSRDTWEGNANRPISNNLWAYGYSSPIIYKDPSGFSPTSDNVDCNKINMLLPYMRALCETANGNDSDPNTLDAREQFFREIAKFSNLQGNFDESYWWAGRMLEHFLDSAAEVSVFLGSKSSFQSDPGIIRATKIRGKPVASDDSKKITPLLYLFLNNIKQKGICMGRLNDQHIPGLPTYSDSAPRPSNMGWWGAFGHVVIDADYSNSIMVPASNGYFLTTNVRYQINDRYEWGHKRGTPLPLGSLQPLGSWRPPHIDTIVESVEIPHSWEVSLVNHNYAYQYDFTVVWREQLQISINKDFTSFTLENESINIVLDK